MRTRHDVGKTVPKWGLSLIFGIMLVTLWGALTEAVVRHKNLLAREPAQAGVAQPAPGQAGGPPPASIQEKVKRLQAAVHKLQEEGRDVSSVAQIAHEFGPLMDAGKFQEAEAVLDRALARAGELSSAEPVGPPASLQQKMARLQELARQREQAGGDMEPVVAIASGVQPLLDEHKYSEAEAQVDRAIALITQAAPTGEQPAATNNVGLTAAIPADAKPLPCPAASATLDLATGTWALKSDCTVAGLNLTGDAKLWVEGFALTIVGNIKLEQNSELHLRGGSFTVANQFKFEHHLEAKGNALLDFRNEKVSTNAGVAANLTSSYAASDNARLYIENVKIEPTTSWLLCNLHDHAQVETKDSPHFPSEIYPTDHSTALIKGAHSAHRVWLYFLPGSSAVFENLPASHPFSFSFGRNTPGVTGIGYQVDVINGNVDFGIRSFPRSEVKVRNVSGNLGADIQFSDVTTPESLTGLKGGMQTASCSNQGRVLSLENAEVPPYGWQLYSTNDGIPLASVAPVTVTDSLVNEMGAFKQGRFEVDHVHFAFAGIAAVGPNSLVHIRDSVINSHTIMGNSDGVVKIEDSEIQGSRVQAIGNSRILILNTSLGLNERGPNCMPLLSSWNGVPLTRCNPANPAHETELVVRGQGAVFVAGINAIAAPIHSGENYVFVGNAIVETPDHKPYTYNLRYRAASATDFTALVTGGAGPKRAQALGELDTTGLAPGDYIVQLELVAPGQEPIVVRRPFTVTASLGSTSAQSPNVPAETQYLLFQVWPAMPGYPGIPPSPGRMALSKSQMAEFVRSVVKAVGATGDARHKLGFAVGPFCFDISDEETRQWIRDAFAVARENDVAVALHIDDSMSWGKRTDLLSNPDNLEAADWKLIPNTARMLAWGPQPSKFPPQMCYNAPAIVAAAKDRATLIGAEINRELAGLKSAGKEYLFAAVIAGSETQISPEYGTGRLLGFRAMAHRGFSEQNPPKDLDAERVSVVKEWIELWANALHGAGTPRDKIFCHIAFTDQGLRKADAKESYVEKVSFAPPEVAFSPDYRPGFSTYPEGRTFQAVYTVLAAHDSPGWISAEGTNVSPTSMPGEATMETYLGRMFNHGGVMVNIFSWGIGGEAMRNNFFRQATENPEALGAYAKFLRGEKLVESAAQGFSASFHDKMHRIQSQLPPLLQQPEQRARLMPLMQKIQSLIKQRQWQEADKVADELLALMKD